MSAAITINPVIPAAFRLTMTSREIADLTGKDLSHIHRDTRTMIDELAGTDDPDLDHVREEKDARGYTTCFHLPKSLTITLMAGYSVKMRYAIVKRWQELEAPTAPAAPAALSTMDILKLAMESEQGRLLAIEQRDQAIATKAHISDKKTATAMATASKHSREVVKLRALIGEASLSASVLAVRAKTRGTEYKCSPLRNYCKANGLAMGTAWSPGIQRDVKTYPAAAWLAVYGVELALLFGEVAS